MSKKPNFLKTKKGMSITAILIAAVLIIGTVTAFAFNSTHNEDVTIISIEKAKNLALEDAGVKVKDAFFTENTFDTEDKTYDIEFQTSTTTYEYEIDAVSGKILEKSSDVFTVKNTEKATKPVKNNTIKNSSTAKDSDKNSSYIGVDMAKDYAINHAKLSKSEVTFTKAKLDSEDGVKVYDIDFYTTSGKYEYEINAKTGAVVNYDFEKISSNKVATDPTNASVTEADYLTLAQIKSIALKDAGVSPSAVTFTKHKLEYDDGIKVYDLEFYTSSAEYDYEINATTGTIIDKECEAVESKPAKDSAIGVDKAKSIALAHAGLSNATFKKAKLDRDDGVTVYEIEFIANGMEYEYTIDAYSGKIIEYDIDD